MLVFFFINILTIISMKSHYTDFGKKTSLSGLHSFSVTKRTFCILRFIFKMFRSRDVWQQGTHQSSTSTVSLHDGGLPATIPSTATIRHQLLHQRSAANRVSWTSVLKLFLLFVIFMTCIKCSSCCSIIQ